MHNGHVHVYRRTANTHEASNDKINEIVEVLDKELHHGTLQNIL